MDIAIAVHLSYSTEQPCDLLMQIAAATDAHQVCRDTTLLFDAETRAALVEGAPHWVAASTNFSCHYETKVQVNRPAFVLVTLQETPRLEIPADVIPYLMPSRYCQSDLFLDFVGRQFQELTGGPFVQAVADWIKANFIYDNGASNASTTATDSFAVQAGVCRDYAHVMIALVRAGGVPARFVSVYAPDVAPQDFHAVVEVYLDGAWYLVDPTGMATPPEMVRICEGRDAADASFLTSYGWMTLKEQSVNVKRISGNGA